MGNLGWLITGGFLKNYRTYVLTGLAALTAVAYWATGDQTTADTMRMLWELFTSGSVATLRAGVGTLLSALIAQQKMTAIGGNTQWPPR